jgi:dihydrofolate reductase
VRALARRPSARPLTYSMMVSVDGYISDPSGSLEWVHIDEELHTFVNDRSREAGAFLYGRRLWEAMAAFWPHGDEDPSQPDYIVDFARIWKATPKYVYSTSLTSVDDAILVGGDGAADHIAALKAEPGGHLEIGGASLAASAIRLGLVDEIGLWVDPVVLGGGTPMFAPDLPRLDLRLLETRTFESGVTYLRYGVDDR